MTRIYKFSRRKQIGMAVAGALTALFVGCRHHDDPLPDPCAGVMVHSLPFKMLDQVGRASFDCDSMFLGTVVFAADPAYSSYEWKVGSDARTFTKQQFSVEFTQPVRVTVQLIGHRTPNTACFPMDKGVDTLRRVLTVLPPSPVAIPHTAIEGKFQGATTDAPTDTFTIRIFRGPNLNDPTQERIYLFNVNKGCQVPGRPALVVHGYQGFDFYQDVPGFPFNGCKLVSGSGALDLMDRRQIRLDYTEQDNGASPKHNKTFIGRRIK